MSNLSHNSPHSPSPHSHSLPPHSPSPSPHSHSPYSPAPIQLLRLKSSPLLRNLCAESEFHPCQLIQPLFVVEGLKERKTIPCLRGNYRESPQSLLFQIEKDLEQGVRHFLLFIIPQQKAQGQGSFNLDFASSTLKGLRERFKNSLHLWVDTCLCSQTENGHCCLFAPPPSSAPAEKQVEVQTQIDTQMDTSIDTPMEIDEEGTLHELAEMAKTYVQAGAHGIAPSDMMDGRTRKIRHALDEGGYGKIPLMSYSTKFASQFYGPFREAAASTPQFGDRSQYQLDVRDASQALRASERCAKEGADLLMVKPGLTSLDLIGPIKERTGLKVGAYQVSGEFAGIHLLAEKNLLDFEKALWESWQVYKRAGSQFIISYGARWLRSCLKRP